MLRTDSLYHVLRWLSMLTTWLVPVATVRWGQVAGCIRYPRDRLSSVQPLFWHALPLPDEDLKDTKNLVCLDHAGSLNGTMYASQELAVAFLCMPST